MRELLVSKRHLIQHFQEQKFICRFSDPQRRKINGENYSIKEFLDFHGLIALTFMMNEGVRLWYAIVQQYAMQNLLSLRSAAVFATFKMRKIGLARCARHGEWHNGLVWALAWIQSSPQQPAIKKSTFITLYILGTLRSLRTRGSLRVTELWLGFKYAVIKMQIP